METVNITVEVSEAIEAEISESVSVNVQPVEETIPVTVGAGGVEVAPGNVCIVNSTVM